MSIKPFQDFELHSKANDILIEKYTGVLPNALINIWKDYGFGTFAKGFMKTINPDEYQELLNDTYDKEGNPVPVFVTAMGDIITWEESISGGDKEYSFEIVRYRYGKSTFLYPVIDLDDDDFFTEVLTDSNMYKNIFYWNPYMEAVKIHGTVPQYDECYGYVPLLGAGGAETPKNLKIVKIKEHIMLIKEMLGRIRAE